MNKSLFKFIIPLLLIMTIIIACGNEPTGNAVDEKPKAEAKTVSTKTASSLGEKVFLLCTACHTLKEGESSKVGPNLHGVFGSTAGKKEGFTFSKTLQESDMIWTEENMSKWLEDPAGFIPGSNMAFIGIKNEKQLKALIEYLKEETK